VIAALLLGGRLLLRPALRWIAGSRTPEIFTAAALLLVVATAALMHAVGLSMALGAFLAGVLLAESEYRRELETDLEPFKGLLLGPVLHRGRHEHRLRGRAGAAGLVAAIVLGFLCVKAVVLWRWRARCALPAGARRCSSSCSRRGRVRLRRLPGRGAGRRDRCAVSSLLVAAVAISMLLSPLALVAADRWLVPRLAAQGVPKLPRLDEPQREAVIIAGFGRYGQIVGRLLLANGIQPTVLDHDSEQIEACAASAGAPSTATRRALDLLRVAGAGRRACW
jgi:glutathione-regulated potassium-efflux system ancillary protein KefC